MRIILITILLLNSFFLIDTTTQAKESEQTKLEVVELYPKVKIETSMGNIILELNRSKAPITVNNFLSYVKNGQYDNTIIHRLDINYVIQGGGYDIKYQEVIAKEAIYNESGNGLKNQTGTIAMAREQDPHSATNQFYFNLNDNDNLDPGRHWGYTVFGNVIEGMNVLETMGDMETVYNEKLDYENFPKKMIVITKVTLLKPDN
ncbi:MAG: peptidyl-prolyl cis-trans isomerase A (cyclophilin A) [Enterobacterales bacterium]|jgi:peptidyl-prolyl cis-trans isomerase A (cyclophilin A)